jgi:hypothetical protein
MNILSTDINYLLVKRGLYYRPNNKGYTGIKEYAGRYEKSDERPESNILAIHEDDAPEFSESCWPEIKEEYYKDKMSELKLKIADILSEVDNTIKLCPISKPSFNSKNDCPKCGASSSQNCVKLDLANNTAIYKIRKLLNGI